MTKPYQLTKINGYLGGIVEGLDLRTIDEETVTQLKADFYERQVLFFPSQHLSPDELAAFGRRFHQLEKPHAGLQYFRFHRRW